MAIDSRADAHALLATCPFTPMLAVADAVAGLDTVIQRATMLHMPALNGLPEPTDVNTGGTSLLGLLTFWS